MLRSLAAATLGLALATAPVASGPAQASGHGDAARLLGTLGAIGITNGTVDRGRIGITIQRGQIQPRYGYRDRRVRRTLPARCLRQVQTRRGPARIFAQRCLARSGVNLRHLPHACATIVRGHRRDRIAYGARCLRHNGWRVARHR